MLASRLIELGCLTLCLFVLGLYGPHAIRRWSIYSGARTRRSRAAGPDAVSAPAAVEALLAQLQDLGFERLGELAVDLPHVGVVYDWLVVDPSRTTFVAAASTGPGAMLVCSSAFADHAWLQTYYPRGETFDTQELLARTSTVSVADAVAVHRRGIEEMRPYQGDPRQIRTIADALELDVEFREHHLTKTLRRNTWSVVTPTIVAAVLAALFVILLLMGW